jgi:Nucleotidyl transferase AbiEii toxin, Type IV TA system
VSGADRSSDWARLFRIARSLIKQVNSNERIIEHWTLGGGTAIMLQIDHRDSHDVDLFLNDAQLLPFLDPKNHDFAFEVEPSDYAGDGTGSIKMSFDGIGEIDFIVRQALTDAPTIEREIEGERTLVETIPEIITKKIVNRGASIKPRDIFDVAAAAERHADAIIAALHRYPDAVNVTLGKLNELNPEFVNRAIQALMIRDSFREMSHSAIERAKEILKSSL